MSKSNEIMRNIYNREGNNITTSNEDYLGRQSLNSLFGDKVVGTRTVYIASQFIYGIEEKDAIKEELNGGIIAVENGMLKGSTGTAPNGRASIQTRRYVRYKPGFDTVAMFTAIFSEPKLNSWQYIGLFGEDNGVFVGYDVDVKFKFFRRNNNVDHKYELDLSKLSFALDTSKGNVYRINYGCPGFAPITLEVLSPKGSWEELFFLEYPNNYTETSLGNAYLNMRGEVGNSGNTTDVVLYSGSIHASVVGGMSDDLTSRYFSHTSGAIAVEAGDTTIIGFKSKDTFAGIANKIASRLGEVIAIPDLTRIAELKLIRNPTITNTPTWNDVDANSVLQCSEDIMIDMGTGEQVFSMPIAKSDRSSKDFTDKEFLLYPNDYVVFVLNTKRTGEFSLFVDWEELF